MRKFLWLIFIVSPLMAQVSNPSIISVSVAPSGACIPGLPNQQVVSTGVQYSCQNGTWGAISGSGSGTVNSGTAGQLAYYAANGTAVSGSTKPYVPANTGDGNIFSASSFANTSAFTANGATASASGGMINFSGGAGTYSQTLDYTAVTTLLPRWKMCGAITIGSSSDILGFGIRSNQAGAAYYSLDANYLQTTGKVNIVSITNTTGSVQATSSGTLTVSTSDVVQLCVQRDFNQFTVTANDTTTQSTQISATFTYSLVYQQSSILPNVGKFAIYSLGGTPSLNNLTISSIVPTYPQVVLLGDSKTVGYYAGSWQATFPTLLQNNFSEVRLAGASDQTADMLAELPEALALKPQAVIIDTYRNDTGVCSNTAPSGTTTNLTSAYNQAVAAGSKSYFLIGMWEPSGTCNQTAIWNWITTNYPNNYIDAGMINYSATASTVVAADNIHPNAFGHTLIYQAIQSRLNADLNPLTYQNYNNWSIANGSLSLTSLGVSGAANFGNNTNPQPVVTVGHCQSNPTTPANVCADTAKTSGSNIGSLTLHTNESVTPNGLLFTYTGNATAASRKWQLQTQEEGSSNTGILDLQPFGGTINMGGGGNTVYRCTVAGTLPIGALTTVSGNCGTAVATALSVN